MKVCEACGATKPDAASRCPACDHVDLESLHKTAVGTPSLTLLILALLVFWGWRFWSLGWMEALPGNIRFAAMVGAALGLTALVSGPLWTFGIRSRKAGAVVLVASAALFLVANTF